VMGDGIADCWGWGVLELILLRRKRESEREEFNVVAGTGVVDGRLRGVDPGSWDRGIVRIGVGSWTLDVWRPND
jgi:hypothetical protein